MRYSSINTAGTVEKLEALGLCFEPFDGRHVPAWEADTKGLFAFRVRTPSVISEPEIGCQGEKTTGTRFTLRDLSGLLARDRSTTGPSGESNARPIESLPHGNAGLRLGRARRRTLHPCSSYGQKVEMKRVYHPYWTWEDYEAGMWTPIRGSARAAMLLKAAEFTGNAELYGKFMQRVIVEWPIACEHNLTERSMNRLAWIGHAACCMAIQCPEDVTREAWALLTDEQRAEADLQAQLALDGWLDAYKNPQIHQTVGAQGIPGRNARQRPNNAGKDEQGPELQGNLFGDFEERHGACVFGIPARENAGIYGAEAGGN